MSFAQGLLQASGFRAGMVLSNPQSTRPIFRKRLFASIAYIVLTIAILFKCFSVQPDTLKKHDFIMMLERVGLGEVWWLVEPGVFSFLIVIVVLVVFSIALFANTSPSGKKVDFSKSLYVTITLLFACVSFAVTYDMFYYLLGNACAPIINVLCLNVSNYAREFAWAALIVYLLRSTFVLLPKENGTIVFFGNEVKDIKGSTAYLIPTAPLPHVVCTLLTYAFEMTPLFFDLYHEPDGREMATQVNHKNLN